MNENKQNNNHFSTNLKAAGTRGYISLYLHPWNNNRTAHYMRSLVTATLVFEYHEQPFWRMVNILNERLDYPLNTEEQDDCYQQLIRDLKRGSL